MFDLATAFDFSSSDHLTGIFHWNINGKISDPDNYQQKGAKETKNKNKESFKFIYSFFAKKNKNLIKV